MFPEIRDCERADVLRPRAALYIIASGIGLLLISLIYRSSPSVYVFLLFCMLGAGCIMEGLVGLVVVFFSAKAEKRWRGSSNGVAFLPQWSCTLGRYLSCMLLVTAVLVPFAMAVPSRFEGPGAGKILGYFFLFGTIVALMCADLPYNRFGKPAIEVDEAGISFWRFGVHSRRITWDVSPIVTGSKVIKGVPRVWIDTNSGPIYFSMSSLPLGYEQLRRVIAFYGTHSELRGELKQQHGLERVRELMYTTIDDIEVELKSGSDRTVG